MSNLAVMAFDEMPRGAGGLGATERIARTLNQSGIDAPSSLYDEALTLAQEGRLAPATERLRMLLCLDPNDADASLLLGKVLANRGQWQESLHWIDQSVANGAVTPPGLRETVEASLRRSVQDAEEARARAAARERGEIRNLRTEAKRLRSENAAMEIQVEELERRVRIWSSATALVAGSAAAMLLASLLFGGSDAPEEIDEIAAAPEVLAPAVIDAPETAPLEPPAAASGPVAAGVAPVEAAPPAAAPVEQKAPEAESAVLAVHTVRKGDTLGRLANKYYGKSSLWPEIQAANKDVLGESVDLSLGMKIKIPRR